MEEERRRDGKRKGGGGGGGGEPPNDVIRTESSELSNIGKIQQKTFTRFFCWFLCFPKVHVVVDYDVFAERIVSLGL